MANIPHAEQSPRIVNGVLRWYSGDTFDLVLELDLVDQDGDPITISASDTVKVVFYNASNTSVKEFTFTNITGNAVTMDFDSTCSALFPSGKYTYDVFYTSSERTTLADRNTVVVD